MLLILVLVLSPHIGILLLSIATVWSFSLLPDGYTLAHYARVFGDSSATIGNTLLYCGLAGADRRRARRAPSPISCCARACPAGSCSTGSRSAALAVPGVVLGIGYLRTFYGVKLPDRHAARRRSGS